MKINNNVSLKSYNTFGVDVHATRFARITSIAQLQEVLLEEQDPVFILGGGSNLLLTQNLDQLVLKNEIKGIDILEDNGKQVTLKVGGGENWHEFTQWCIQKDFGGVENLSLIPGTVGAAPIQNIGAYGVELKDVFVKLDAIELKSGHIRTFSRTECKFDYRDSIFKKKWKGAYFITHVYLSLTKNIHQINTSYGAINQLLEQKGISAPTIKAVSEAVIAIRSSKLPDPAQLGNSGSFFKNPMIDLAHFQQLQQSYPDIVSYPAENGKVKVPAGWLIERCGWKGKKVGNTGCYKHQALVIVNYGGATGSEIEALAEAIMESVKTRFDIQLSPEVNIV